jgi:hypothetical protein
LALDQVLLVTSLHVVNFGVFMVVLAAGVVVQVMGLL